MAFNDIERARINKEVAAYVAKRRPAPYMRAKVDLAFRLEGQSIVIFEVRPKYLDPSITVENNIARATYVRTKDVWKVFWQRADLKWHGYEPDPIVDSVGKFLSVVETDEYGCFWG